MARTSTEQTTYEDGRRSSLDIRDETSLAFKTRPVRFALVILVAVGIIFIGARFLFSPIVAADGFGVPNNTQTFAYLWAKGTRDIVSGLFVLLLVWLRVSRRVLGSFIAVAALIPIGDLINVYINLGIKNPTALLIHGGTAVFMLVLAAFLRARNEAATEPNLS